MARCRYHAMIGPVPGDCKSAGGRPRYSFLPWLIFVDVDEFLNKIQHGAEHVIALRDQFFAVVAVLRGLLFQVDNTDSGEYEGSAHEFTTLVSSKEISEFER